MSGIAAVWHVDGRPVAPAELQALIDAVRHRGPDGSAVWCDGAVGLGFGRFDTTPEALGDPQPAKGGADGQVVAVMDGRVDDREALRASLAAAGARPRGGGDAELMLQAYLAWGPDCVARVLGDWAVVVWDGRLGRLFFARDAFGVRPLFYWDDGASLVIGSEPRQVQAHPGVPQGLHWGVVGELLCNRWVASEETMFAGVRRLLGGHAAVRDRDGLRVWRYWPTGRVAPVRHARQADYEAHFRDLFEASIRDRLRSATPVGLLLSGGLDSSAIACMTDRMVKATPEAFPATACLSITCPGFDCDESPYIDAVARSIAMPAHCVAWGSNPGRRPDLSLAVRFPDLLFSPGAIGGMLQYAPLATASGMRVLLDGIGGDELFSVPFPHLVDPLRAGDIRLLWRRAQLAARTWGTSPWRVVLRHGLWEALPATVLEAWRAARRRVSPRPEARVKPWIEPAFAARHALAERMARPRPAVPSPPGEAKRLLSTLLSVSYNAVFALEWNDLVLARLGLEKRHPFFDRRLAEFCLAIPEQTRVGDATQTKVLLRRSLHGIMPKVIVNRTSKPAFDSMNRAEVNSRQAAAVDALFTDARLEQTGVLVPGAEHRLLAAYRRGDERAAVPVTTILGFELALATL